MATTSSFSLARSRCWQRISQRISSKRAPTAGSPAQKRARVSAWCSQTQALVELVVAEGIDRNGEQAGVAVRAQAQVGLEQDAGRGLARQPGVQALAEAGIVFFGIGVGVVVEVNQVEVRDVAEFLAAQLAVADDGEFRRRAMPLPDRPPAQRERFLNDDVGQFGEVVGQRLDGLQSGQVLRQQAEDLRVVHFAQDVHFAFGVAGMVGQAAPQILRGSSPSRWRCRRGADRAVRRAAAGGGPGSRWPTTRRRPCRRRGAAPSDTVAAGPDRRRGG